MRCEERVKLLREYLAKVRAYTAAVEELKKHTDLSMVEFDEAFNDCDLARELSRQAQQLLLEHVEMHGC